MAPATVLDVAAAERALVDLLALERELLELDYVRRADALERVSEAVRRLGELGSPEGLLTRAAGELGQARSSTGCSSPRSSTGGSCR